MTKVGKSAKDIFASTTKTEPKAPAATATRPAGRPPVHEDAWSKVTVVLFDRQIAYLDRISADIREKSGKAVSRAELLRAMVDAVQKAGIDLSGAKSEADVVADLFRRLNR